MSEMGREENATSQSISARYDSPANQVVFADGASGFSLNGGVARINLLQTVYDPSPTGGGEQYNVIAARLAMPLPSYLALHKWMGDQIEGMRQAGIDIGALSNERGR